MFFKKEIKLIFKKGKKINKKIFNIKYLKNKKYNKILIIIPKKFIKKAVKRNKIKRIIYNSYLINKYILCNNLFFIIFIYKTYKIYKFNFLNKKILNCLKKINENFFNSRIR
ncbi:MAG: ribonuclease P protein component [Candidatus Shikimatogenerans bostrichidophilus]|nr:MAG: ribonuclease P protein component [Candidatus Shikimatogenerans bostrichidophilus]